MNLGKREQVPQTIQTQYICFITASVLFYDHEALLLPNRVLFKIFILCVVWVYAYMPVPLCLGSRDPERQLSPLQLEVRMIFELLCGCHEQIQVLQEQFSLPLSHLSSTP